MKIVHYKPDPDQIIRVGRGTIVYPIDHPDTDNVSNTKPVITSRVLSVNLLTGEFTTENSRYIPLTETTTCTSS